MNLRHSPIGEANLIGERVCLDFTNTVGGRRGSEIIFEKLKTYDDLLAWSVHVGILKQRDMAGFANASKRRAQQAAGVLNRAAQLREAIYRICVATLKRDLPNVRDMELLNQEIRAARSHEAIQSTKAGFRVQSKSTNKDLDRMLWAVAISAADLLTKEDINRLRQCEGENCGWLFVDTSKNHSRQWCDMSDCGNRAKVRRFRSKRT